MWWNGWIHYQWLPMLLPFFVVALVLKGFALYRAARNTQKGWFVALLIVNTLGILEAIYLLFFSALSDSKGNKTRRNV